MSLVEFDKYGNGWVYIGYEYDEDRTQISVYECVQTPDVKPDDGCSLVERPGRVHVGDKYTAYDIDFH